MVDGDLIQRYLLIPHSVRVEVAKKSGQCVQSVSLHASSLGPYRNKEAYIVVASFFQIMDDIADIGAITLHF